MPSDTTTTAQIRANSKTYFLDLKKTKQGSAYLQITESRKGQNNQFVRSTINLFPESFGEFIEALTRLAQLV